MSQGTVAAPLPISCPVPYPPASKQALVLKAHEAAPAACLQQRQHLSQTLVTELLQDA